MRAVYYLFVVLLAKQVICGIIRNPPAFSEPVYSESYLPAAMQVIYHAVEQLKALQSEEAIQSSTTAASLSTSPINHATQNAQHSPIVTAPSTAQSANETKIDEEEATTKAPPGEKVEESKEREPSKDIAEETSSMKPSHNEMEGQADDRIEESSNEKIKETSEEREEPEESSGQKKSTDGTGEQKVEECSQTTLADPANVKTVDSKIGETSDCFEIAGNPTEDTTRHQESPEVNEETPETNYGTPETNYESPEDVHAMQETNHEVPEEDHQWTSSSRTNAETKLEAMTESSNNVHTMAKPSIVENNEQKKEVPTIDRVVEDVYEILKPTTSKLLDGYIEAPEKSKSAVGISLEKVESIEEEDDETRFTQLGEKVTQVPRPSLSSYLRRSKVPPSATLQQLANLYDSLSKDARKQGFGKYTGYSDEVLNTLKASAEGGIGPQLKKLLSKVLERNELTREDARTKTSQAIRDLNNPSSTLSKELRPLLPLRYTP